MPITRGDDEDEDEAGHHQKDRKDDEPFRKEGQESFSEGRRQYRRPRTHSLTHVGSSLSFRPLNNSCKLLNSKTLVYSLVKKGSKGGFFSSLVELLHKIMHILP